MANVKISQLPGGSSPLTGVEQVPMVQGGATVIVDAQYIGRGTTNTSKVPYYNGLELTSSPIDYQSDFGGTLQTFNSSNYQRGFLLNFYNDTYIFGATSGYEYVALTVTQTDAYFTRVGSRLGLSLDFSGNIFALGDPLNAQGGINLKVSQYEITTSQYGSTALGILLNYTAMMYTLGDLYGYQSGANVTVNTSLDIAYFGNPNNSQMFGVDFAGERLIASPNLTQSVITDFIASGNSLKIVMNDDVYYIPLLVPN